MSVKNKTAFITGTVRGIGKATVNVFAEKGWDVIAHARTPSDEFENDLVALSSVYGVTITPVYFDLTDTNAMKECVKNLRKNKVFINALVNNAGVSSGGLFQMTPVPKIKEIFDVNLFAQMELTQLILKIMVKECAAIVNVASVTGVDFRKATSAYGVSKAALIAWTKVLQTELKGEIRVNAVAPGYTDTDMANSADDEYRAQVLSRTVMNRLAKPEEIANTIYFLASDDSSFITGQVLKADGGGGYIY